MKRSRKICYILFRVTYQLWFLGLRIYFNNYFLQDTQNIDHSNHPRLFSPSWSNFSIFFLTVHFFFRGHTFIFVGHLSYALLFFTGQSLIFNIFNLKAGGMPYILWCPLGRHAALFSILSGFSTMVYNTPCSTDIYSRGHQQNDVTNKGRPSRSFREWRHPKTSTTDDPA